MERINTENIRVWVIYNEDTDHSIGEGNRMPVFLSPTDAEYALGKFRESMDLSGYEVCRSLVGIVKVVANDTDSGIDVLRVAESGRAPVIARYPTGDAFAQAYVDGEEARLRGEWAKR